MVGRLSEPQQKKNKKDTKMAPADKHDSIKAGRVQKAKGKRPLPQKVKKDNKAARRALRTGEVQLKDIEARKERDLRSLYIRFKNRSSAPSTEDEIRAIAPKVVFVRIQRQSRKKEARNIHYCFLEFDSEANCEAAKTELSKNTDYFVDFVGEKSRNAKYSSKEDTSVRRPINPLRLFISGLPSSMTVDKLKLLFPRSTEAIIKTKGAMVGFVQFHNAADAKAAFDATQQLKSGIPGVSKLTVTYAKMAKRQNKDKKKEAEEVNVDTEETSLTEDASEPKEDMESDDNDEAEDDDDDDVKEEEEGDDDASEDDEEMENDVDSDDE